MILRTLRFSCLSLILLSTVGCTTLRVDPADVAAGSDVAARFDVVAALALTEPLDGAERVQITADVRALLAERAKLQDPEFVGWLLVEPARVAEYLDVVSAHYLSGVDTFRDYLARTGTEATTLAKEFDVDARTAWLDLRQSVGAAQGGGVLPADVEAKARVVLSGLTKALLTFNAVRTAGI